MCGTTLIAQEATMATTQLLRTAVSEFRWPTPAEQKADFKPLSMNWVVVTDENGNRRLKMQWRADLDD